ncbi:MAG TPA: acyl-CoA synthetase [Rhodocyclaceae bacterium]|nr:acyl-CoA synthetase [Rhodocyclaceae bacterium]
MNSSSAQSPSSVSHEPVVQTWAQQEERGSLFALQLMCRLSLCLGRRTTRPILYFIAAYFVVAAPVARRASRDYLSRVLKRPPTMLEIFRHFLCFATSIHDRVFLLNNREDLFDIRTRGVEDLAELQAQRGGVLLFGSHVGSFDAMRATARSYRPMTVYSAMYEENARKIGRVFAAINPAAAENILPLGRPDSMLAVHDRLAEGAVVSILADRSFGNDSQQSVMLFGNSAPLPEGPFRMAAILRVPVMFIICLYRGGNRYDIQLEHLADFGDCPPGQRASFTRDVQQRFAERLEYHCRNAPYNWFNFYEFWNPPTKALSSSGRLASGDDIRS